MEVSKMVNPNVKRAKALEITTDDKIYMIGRILYADTEPLNYTLTFLPGKIFPGLSKYDLKKESLYRIMTEVYGVKITKARRTIEAIGAQDEEVTANVANENIMPDSELEARYERYRTGKTHT